MSKVVKKEKINYLKPSPRKNLNNLEDIIYSNDYQNNNTNTNNDINTTLTNISNQLKNIALVDKIKEQKILNSSFRVTNRNRNLNSFFDTTNIEMNQRFQNLQKKQVFNFAIAKNIKYEDNNIEEIQKENLELKENIKFLLKQIKRYQKSGLTIEDMNVNREQKMEKLEKEISQLKNDLINYKNQITALYNENKELKKENKEVKKYLNNIDFLETRKRKNKIYEKKYNTRDNNLNYNSINNYVYKNKNIHSKNEKNENEEEENENNSNSKSSEKLLYEINKELLQGKIMDNKNRSYLSEGKLYCRKNVTKNLSFNFEPNNMNRPKNNNKSNNIYAYSKNFLKNKTQN